MNNFKTLLKSEIQNQTHSFVFLLMIVVALLMTLTCGYIQLADFTERQATYQEELRMSSQKQEETMVYSQFSIPVLITPNLLSVFHKGIEESVGNKVDISPVKLTDFQETAQRRNPFLSIFSDMDISGIVKILSLFTLILASGLISGERENNTYKLIFANSVKRTEYYLSKYCATGISVLLSLTVLFLSLSILFVSNSMIQISGIAWLKLFTLFLSSFLYLSVFILLGLLLSSRSGNAGGSVLGSVLLWITISFIYPNLVSTLVNKPLDTESRSMKREIKRIEDDSFNEFTSLSFNLRHPEGKISVHILPGKDFDQNVQEQKLLTRLSMQDITMMAFIGMCEKWVLEGSLIKWESLFPVYFKYQQDIRAQRDILHQKQLEQQRTNHLYTCFLPDILYEQAVSSLSGTNISYRDEYIQDALRMYRSQVFDYLNNKKAFSEKFYTQFPKELWEDYWEDYPQSIIDVYSHEDHYPRISYKDAPSFVLNQKNEFPVELLFISGINLLLFFIGLGMFQSVKK